jgi:hypothetical protein
VSEDAVSKLLGYVDEANAIAKDCFARGEMELGVEAVAVALHYLQAARAFQDMHDAGSVK